MVENSAKCLSGIDTLTYGKVLVARCSLNEPLSSLSFRVEVTREAEIDKLINHMFYVIRKENKDDIFVDKVKPIAIEVVKKNY